MVNSWRTLHWHRILVSPDSRCEGDHFVRSQTGIVDDAAPATATSTSSLVNASSAATSTCGRRAIRMGTQAARSSIQVGIPANDARPHRSGCTERYGRSPSRPPQRWSAPGLRTLLILIDRVNNISTRISLGLRVRTLILSGKSFRS
jgi:hypothetical protein